MRRAVIADSNDYQREGCLESRQPAAADTASMAAAVAAQQQLAALQQQLAEAHGHIARLQQQHQLDLAAAKAASALVAGAVNAAVYDAERAALKAAASAAQAAAAQWEAECDLLRSEQKQLRQERQQQQAAAEEAAAAAAMITAEREELRAECESLKAELTLLKQQQQQPFSPGVVLQTLPSSAGGMGYQLQGHLLLLLTPGAATPLRWSSIGSAVFQTPSAAPMAPASASVSAAVQTAVGQQQQQTPPALPLTPGTLPTHNSELASRGSDAANNAFAPMEVGPTSACSAEPPGSGSSSSSSRHHHGGGEGVPGGPSGRRHGTSVVEGAVLPAGVWFGGQQQQRWRSKVLRCWLTACRPLWMAWRCSGRAGLQCAPPRWMSAMPSAVHCPVLMS